MASGRCPPPLRAPRRPAPPLSAPLSLPLSLPLALRPLAALLAAPLDRPVALPALARPFAMIVALLVAAGYGRRFDPTGSHAKLEARIDGAMVAVQTAGHCWRTAIG